MWQVPSNFPSEHLAQSCRVYGMQVQRVKRFCQVAACPNKLTPVASMQRIVLASCHATHGALFSMELKLEQIIRNATQQRCELEARADACSSGHNGSKYEARLCRNTQTRACRVLELREFKSTFVLQMATNWKRNTHRQKRLEF
eukprot:6475060-Amphidinium_carterae.1